MIAFLLLLALSGLLAIVVGGQWGAMPATLVILAGAVLALVRLRRARRTGKTLIVVDGSNVLHWDGNEPRIATLRAVLGDLAGRGLRPVVWFDANVGYLIDGRHANAARMARLLDLPERQVRVMPRGRPADPALLAAAARLDALVVSNDRFRDWPAYARRDPGAVRVGGRVDAGRVHLRFPADLGTGAP